MKFKRQTEKLGSIESIQLWMLPPPKNIKKNNVAASKDINQFPHILAVPSYSPSSKENRPSSGKLQFFQ